MNIRRDFNCNMWTKYISFLCRKDLVGSKELNKISLGKNIFLINFLMMLLLLLLNKTLIIMESVYYLNKLILNMQNEFFVKYDSSITFIQVFYVVIEYIF